MELPPTEETRMNAVQAETTQVVEEHELIARINKALAGGCRRPIKRRAWGLRAVELKEVARWSLPFTRAKVSRTHALKMRVNIEALGRDLGVLGEDEVVIADKPSRYW
jgi:hypothetical protein